MKRWNALVAAHPRLHRALLHMRANMWELAIAWAFSIIGVWQLVDRNDSTALSRVWGWPWDVALVAIGTYAAVSITASLVVWAPRVRASSLVLLGGYFVELGIAAVHVRGFASAAPGVAAYGGLAVAAFGRALDILIHGDYPPVPRATARRSRHP